MQVGEEFLFGIVHHAIGIADANGHFVGERARRRGVKLACGGRQREFSAEHVLINRGHVQALAGKAIDDLFDSRAFVFALRPVRESGEHADADNGAVFLLIYWKWFNCHGRLWRFSEPNSHSNPVADFVTAGFYST